jgi:hypothetical protein
VPHARTYATLHGGIRRHGRLEIRANMGATAPFEDDKSTKAYH